MTDSTRKLLEWGSYLEACETHEALTQRALELKAMRYAVNERGERVLTDTEYTVLAGLGKSRRAELNELRLDAAVGLVRAGLGERTE